MNICLTKFRNKHAYGRCFIIANGPSLAKTDLDLLKDETCIAMNRISLMYDKHEWRPTYYIYASTNVNNKDWGDAWTQSVQTALNVPSTKSFVAEKFRDRVDPKNKYNQVNWLTSISESKPDIQGNINPSCFSTDVVKRIDKSGTSVNIALQLAYHMGFAEIVFVGADLGWTKDKGSHSDPNHFDKNYRADISNPEKANYQMRNVHSLALKNFKERGAIKIYNASKKTVLDVYPIIELEEYLKGTVVVREEDVAKAKEFWTRPAQYNV